MSTDNNIDNCEQLTSPKSSSDQQQSLKQRDESDAVSMQLSPTTCRRPRVLNLSSSSQSANPACSPSAAGAAAGPLFDGFFCPSPVGSARSTPCSRGRRTPQSPDTCCLVDQFIAVGSGCRFHSESSAACCLRDVKFAAAAVGGDGDRGNVDGNCLQCARHSGLIVGTSGFAATSPSGRLRSSSCIEEPYVFSMTEAQLLQMADSRRFSEPDVTVRLINSPLLMISPSTPPTTDNQFYRDDEAFFICTGTDKRAKIVPDLTPWSPLSVTVACPEFTSSGFDPPPDTNNDKDSQHAIAKTTSAPTLDEQPRADRDASGSSEITLAVGGLLVLPGGGGGGLAASRRRRSVASEYYSECGWRQLESIEEECDRAASAGATGGGSAAIGGHGTPVVPGRRFSDPSIVTAGLP